MEGIEREARRISLGLFGNPDVLANVDAVLCIDILSYVNRRPALGKAEALAIQAIVHLADHDVPAARTLMDDLRQALL